MKYSQPRKQPKLPAEVTKLIPKHLNSHKKIDIAEILALRRKGYSPGAVAKVLGCSKTNIQSRYAKIEKEVMTLGHFKEHRADVLAIKQKMILDRITRADVSKVGLRDKVIAFGVLYDKERLERNKGITEQGIKIEIINYAGASNTGQGVASKVTFIPKSEEIVDADTV